MKYNNLSIQINRYGKYVIQQARSILTKSNKGGGALYNSLKYEALESNTIGNPINLDFYMEDYGIFQDQGVKGANPALVKNGKQKAPLSPFSYKSKMPPMQVLKTWAKEKKIRFRNKDGTYSAGNYDRIAFWLQKRVFAQGISPTYFFTKPEKAGLQKYNKDIIDAFVKDIDINLDFSENK